MWKPFRSADCFFVLSTETTVMKANGPPLHDAQCNDPAYWNIRLRLMISSYYAARENMKWKQFQSMSPGFYRDATVVDEARVHHSTPCATTRASLSDKAGTVFTFRTSGCITPRRIDDLACNKSFRNRRHPTLPMSESEFIKENGWQPLTSLTPLKQSADLMRVYHENTLVPFWSHSGISGVGFFLCHIRNVFGLPSLNHGYDT
jgi:hypothetical protein